ncbi:MAG: putative serine/threonine kinase anti-sigma factor [Ilumatobacteraceae bacterium]|nr:putative serine/threonine kinase anti-sigma factor [Ilumatobacteraceae bacterium]
MSESEVLTTSLPRDLSAPRLARRWISEQLNPRGLTSDEHDAIVLLVSELVSNVVLHTESDPVVTLRVDPGKVLVGVEDLSEHVAHVRQPTVDVERPGGWGLRIVDQMADSWGADVIEGRKVVWFEVGVSGA